MSKKKMIFLSLIVMALWGSLFPMIKLGYNAYNIRTTGDILLFAGIRFTVCGTLISLYSFIKGKKNFKALKTSAVPVLLMGLFAIILHYGFTYTGLKFTDSSKTAILKQVGVIFYVCFAGLFFKDDKLTAGKLLGVLLGFAGIIVINVSDMQFSWHIGDTLIIAASFCTVFANIVSKKVFLKVEPITATGISQLFGGIVLLAAGMLMGGKMDFSMNFSAFIFVYICLASIFGYCIWYVIVKDGSLSKLFIIKFAEPVFASIFSAIILGENIFTWEYMAAFVMITAGIYISSVKKEQ